MLAKCANPACSVPFRRLREGKLFQVETEYMQAAQEPALPRKNRPLRRVEHYWLCDRCSACVTLTFDRERGVVTVPLPGGGQKTITVIPFHQPSRAEDTLAVPVHSASGTER